MKYIIFALAALISSVACATVSYSVPVTQYAAPAAVTTRYTAPVTTVNGGFIHSASIPVTRYVSSPVVSHYTAPVTVSKTYVQSASVPVVQYAAPTLVRHVAPAVSYVAPVTSYVRPATVFTTQQQFLSAAKTQ